MEDDERDATDESGDGDSDSEVSSSATVINDRSRRLQQHQPGVAPRHEERQFVQRRLATDHNWRTGMFRLGSSLS